MLLIVFAIGITGLFQRNTVVTVIIGMYLHLSGVAVGMGPVVTYLMRKSTCPIK